MAYMRKAVRQVMDLYMEASGSIGTVKETQIDPVNRVKERIFKRARL